MKRAKRRPRRERAHRRRLAYERDDVPVPNAVAHTHITDIVRKRHGHDRPRILADLDAVLARGENDLLMRGLAAEMSDQEFVEFLDTERTKRRREKPTS